MRKEIFLENLPRLESGANKGKINWNKSIGYKVKFIYDDINDIVEIIDYKNKKLLIKYKNNTLYISTGHFSNCQFGKLLNKRTIDFKIEIGVVIKDDKRDITIIDREYRIGKNGQYLKYYKYHCNIDNNEDWIRESNLLTKKQGCNVCSGDKIMLGVNTIWDKARWMCDLGVSEEDAKKYMPQSNEPIIVTCPHCKTKKEIKIYQIYRDKSIRCSCGDGKSYPEKFIYYAFKQVEEYFETEYSPEYLKREENRKLSQKRNDFYLPNHSIVVEADGMIGHEGGIVHGKSIKTIDELVEIDRWKEEQNLKHGIKTIRINCFESDPNYIKNSMLTSELAKYIDFSNIDWNKCEEFALKNIVYEVCKYWREHKEVNKEYITTTSLSKIFNLSTVTIRKYLKKGTKLNWCNYNPKEESDKTLFKKGIVPHNIKTTLMYDKNMDLIGIYESTNWIDRHSEELFGIHLDFRNISAVCRGKLPHYKGYIFKYAD